MRLVLDTNVLVSALLFRGAASALRDLWRAGEFRLAVTGPTLAELARVLAYPKFKVPPGTVEAVMAGEVLPFADEVVPRREPPACRDPSDDEFLWCARDGEARALVTGDPDLLVLRPAWEGVPILTIPETIALLSSA